MAGNLARIHLAVKPVYDDDCQLPDSAAYGESYSSTQPGSTEEGLSRVKNTRKSSAGRQVLSRRRLKAIRPSPSTHLIEALRASGQYHATPTIYPHRRDLSYADPRGSSGIANGRRLRTKALVHHKKQRLLPLCQSEHDISLQSVLARFIRHTYGKRPTSASGRLADLPSDLDSELPRRVFLPQELSQLRARGYNIQDVGIWASIIVSRDPIYSARMLAMASITEEQGALQISGPIPTFVLLFVLRRAKITAAALQLLLIAAWERIHTVPFRNGYLHGQHQSDCAEVQYNTPPESSLLSVQGVEAGKSTNYHRSPVLSDTTIFLIFVRLLRHARKALPHAIANIASMITWFIHERYYTSTQTGNIPRLSRLTFLYNRTLYLLSLSTSLTPYSSSAEQERALFDVLRIMDQHKVAITREGYRAVTRILLARKKTTKEQDWAELKSDSWPPFKENKTRMDEEKGLDYGTSRAGQAIRRMQEAGYGKSSWDHVANVFAGWNTDGTPTIQTRTMLGAPPAFPLVHRTDQDLMQQYSDLVDSNLWAARVTATRTLQEAWDCFTSYERCQQPPRKLLPHQDVYLAMFEKIHYDEQRTHQQRVRQKRPNRSIPADSGLPGDSKEVLAALDPNMRSNPPSIEELFDNMITKGLQPHSKCLEFLVGHANSLRQGFKFVKASSKAHKESIKSLLLQGEAQTSIDKVPHGIFTAFIQLLCRFPYAKRSEQALSWLGKGIHYRNRFPVAHAFRLLQLRRPLHAPAWNALLAALAKTGITVTNTTFSQQQSFELMEINEFMHMCKAVATMTEIHLDLDAQGFRYLCIGAERATMASIKILEDGSVGEEQSCNTRGTLIRRVKRTSELGTPQEADKFVRSLEGSIGYSNARSAAKIVLRDVPSFIRLKFQALVGSRDRATSVRASRVNVNLRDAGLPTIPRLLAIPGPVTLHAYARALGVLRDYEGLLSLVQWMVEAKDELVGVIEEQRGGFRRLRQALTAVRVFLEQGAPDEILAMVQQLVDSVEEWGGWPVDEELEMYRYRGGI